MPAGDVDRGVVLESYHFAIIIENPDLGKNTKAAKHGVGAGFGEMFTQSQSTFLQTVY